MNTYQEEIEESIDLLREAQTLLRQANERIREAVRGTLAEDIAEAYTLPELEMLTSKDHQWLGQRNGNLDALIALVEQDAQ